MQQVLLGSAFLSLQEVERLPLYKTSKVITLKRKSIQAFGMVTKRGTVSLLLNIAIAFSDVIVYRFQGTLIIHRVIAIYDNANPPYVIVKGDNNPVPDQNITGPRQITNSLIVGRVVMLVEGLGIFADTSIKYIFSASLIILVLLDYYLASKPEGSEPKKQI